ncbi:MAG: HEAT repeat domain-containing protein [Acidimicrobiales bacterium]
MDDPTALSDQQLDAFLTDGYLTLKPSQLSVSDHERLYRRAVGLYDTARALGSPTVHLDVLGDNLRAQIPEVEALLADPVIDGALTSILGSDYMIHPHSYCHRSGDEDQPFHQDGNLPWNERGHYRSHRLDWAMLFYYPQAVDDRNGPTEIIPGTQYWTMDHETPDGAWNPGDRLDESLSELNVPDLNSEHLHLPAGTAVLAHYDLVHRGTHTSATEPRFMYKFYFARVHSPERTGRDPQRLATVAKGPVRPVVVANQRWLSGLRFDDGRDFGRALGYGQLAKGLVDEREDTRIATAYGLGRAAAGGDAQALEALTEALHAPTESTRRAASHGLRRAGRAGVPALLEGLRSELATVRRPAAAGLGTLDAAAWPEATDALISTLGADPDILVRSNAAYSLGQIARSAEIDPAPVVDALLDRLAPDAEPDNAFGASFSRSTVRQSAAYGLVQGLANHVLADEQLEQIVAQLQIEPDRYVRGLLVEGLARAEHLPAATRRLFLGYLAGRRWNPAGEAKQ